MYTYVCNCMLLRAKKLLPACAVHIASIISLVNALLRAWQIGTLPRIAMRLLATMRRPAILCSICNGNGLRLAPTHCKTLNMFALADYTTASTHVSIYIYIYL